MSILTLAMPGMSDQSVSMLDQILGSNFVPSILGISLGSTPTQTFAEMISKYNALLFSFGAIIFAIMLFVGTMNTASEGQFLGKQWDGVWTPVRLIIGLAFIWPLQTGYCVGQYIFMYIILVGINMGTSLWNTVVEDAFAKYSPPAIPSYMHNYAVQMLEQNIIMDMVAHYMTSGTSENVQIPAGYTMSVGSVSPEMADSIASLISQPPSQSNNNAGGTNSPSYFSGQVGSGCYALYNSAPAIQACINAVSTTLVTPTQSGTNLVTWGNGNMMINISSVAPIKTGTAYPSTDLIQNPDNFVKNTWPGGSPDGKMLVSGSYTVTSNSSNLFSNNKIVPQDSPAATAFNSTLGIGTSTTSDATPSACGSTIPSTDPTNLLKDYEAKYLFNYPQNSATTFCKPFWEVPNPDPNTNDPPPQPTPQYMSQFSLDPIATAAINAAITAMNKDDKSAPSNQFGQCGEDANGETVCGLYEVNGNYSYEIQGMPYINDQGEQEYGNPINVPLSGSWWNAGQSYLILDAQFAANLQDLSQIIASNMNVINNSLTLTGNLTFSFYLAMAEYGPLYTQGGTTNNYNLFNPTSGNSGAVNTITYPSSGSSGTVTYPGSPAYVYLGNTGQAMGYYAYYNNVSLPGPMDLSDLFLPSNSSSGTQTAWEVAIAPFDPNAASDFPSLFMSSDPSYVACPVQSSPGLSNLFQALQSVPPYYQTGLEMLLNYASKQADCSGAKGVTLTQLVQPLENLMFMMDENGIIANQADTEQLPVNQAMNSIFSQLLGNANVTGVAAGVSPVGLNSVMQDVYNLGMDTDTSGVSGQFSLIQEVRTAGIEMITACISSMQAVYGQYTAITTGMLQQVNAKVAQAKSAAGEIEDYSWIPFGGGAIAAAVATVKVQDDMLDMQVITLTTMSQIALQLMWMPVFLFVISALFSAGVEFALVIPFMPYMMFWGGQVAWLLGVLEALVAAPLVMLGIAHPGGNQYIGHANGAVRLLIGVVFRPVLMIIGMTVGILLTYVLINFSAQGFHVVADNTFNTLPVGNQTLAGIMSCILLFSYCSFLMMAFTKCFSPIYSIPEGVVRWIGGEAAQGGKEEAQQFGQSVKSSADKAAQAGGEAMQKGVGAQEKRGENYSQMDQKKAQTSFDNAQAVGKAETEVSQAVVGAAKAAAGGE